MERPDLSKVTPEIREYIEAQDEKLDLLTSDNTIANLYTGLKVQLDQIGVILIVMKITVANFTDKDDKGNDRYFKYMEKSRLLAENLQYLEKMVAPDKIEKAKVRSDAIAEQYIFDHQEETG